MGLDHDPQVLHSIDEAELRWKQGRQRPHVRGRVR